MPRRPQGIVLSALLCGAFIGSAEAQELEKKARFGLWSVVCDGSTPRPQCSVVAAAHADDDPHLWSKVGMFLAGDELQMIFRTPRLDNVRNGISIGFDGVQFGRAFLDRCDLTSCEAAIGVGPELRSLIGTRKKMTVHYPTSDNEGAALAFNLDGIVPALGSLRNQPNESEAIASVEDFRRSNTNSGSSGRGSTRTTTGASNTTASSGSTTTGSGEPAVGGNVPSASAVKLERRQVPRTATSKQAQKAWNQPLNECGKTPPTTEVRVNAENEIMDSDELHRWLAGSKKCGDVLVWVIPKNKSAAPASPSASDRKTLALYRVYGSVRAEMPKVVISTDDKDRVPLQGSTGLGSSSFGAVLR